MRIHTSLKILFFVFVFISSLQPTNFVFSHTEEYTLEVMEKIAIERAPELEQLRSRKIALEDSAIADGQMADPKLQAGIINVPTDTFSNTQENMTQIKFALVQDFPRGNSLSLRTEQQKLLAKGEDPKSAIEN
ncbi:MAG: hypothetical protein HON43_04960 [Alphaproteobacteria bacterium]|nr:hypothetical protein [Alphaproteobacteria bacterium]MBT5389292.1 hypothetical protein [Alphaproteobacteria bacterium]MBT5540581.1 hypothetical protein [Alphaproteobacteria bacterium]